MNQVLDDLSSLRWNRSYRIWKPFMQKYNCKVVAEIGVRTGRNFEKMISHRPEMAVAVDIWRDESVTSRNDLKWPQERLDAQYEDFVKRVGFMSNIQVLREYSFNAVKWFPDEYFDFVYIDADHTYEAILRDITDWWPKVKPGKFLLGDDYFRHTTKSGVKFGVIEAVNKFARDNELSFFVFPRSKWGMVKR